MSIESTSDLDGLREVARITRLTLDALEAAVRPGVTTAMLDSVAAALIAGEGARSAPAFEYGFPGTVLISVNDEIVHGIPGPRVLLPGDLVSLDVTLEKAGYVADAARSVVVAEGRLVAHRRPPHRLFGRGAAPRPVCRTISHDGQPRCTRSSPCRATR